jgi:hypothetical protein
VLFLYEIVAFIAGTVITRRLWSKPVRLLRYAALAAAVMVLVLVILGFTGWPLLQARLHHRELSSTSHEALEQIHFVSGHLSLTLVAFATPLFLGAALRRQSHPGKIAHAVLALFIVTTWILLTISGYMLPPSIPTAVPQEVASTVLRFVVIHATVVPLLTAVALLLLIWRNRRVARSVAAA